MKNNVFENNSLQSIDEDSLIPEGTPKKNCFADFLVDSGLYSTIEITRDNINELCDLINGKVKISTYCSGCKEKQVFSMKAIVHPHKLGEKILITSLAESLQDTQKYYMMLSDPRPGLDGRKSIPPQWFWTKAELVPFTRVMVFPFICAMDSSHRLDYVVRTDGNTMTKIGQFPTVADLAFPELDELKKVIDTNSRKELRRAIGLHAQGIGVGSYVYLRRIFERVLNEAKTEAELAGTVDLSGFDGMKVDKRIRLLKDYLPAMINDNHVFYGIVSKGIHELSEDECISYFPVLKEAIFMILRQWAQKKQEQEAAKRLSASLSKIASQVNS